MDYISCIEDTEKDVKYVYHIADIHIRYLDRHQEYKEVFERLVDFIKSDKNKEESIMVICGDIFHNKDRFVSETIIFFDDLLKRISSLLKVFIILGNHDVFNHKDRLDALSGIMKIKDYPNVHILKKSGFYKYANIVFGVSSLIDKKMTTCPKNKEKYVYIGLYHGIVMGCSIPTKGVSLDNFNNYDIVMLGDVHKRQYLNKKQTIAYPGSLIQQNFKEDLEHGFLLWNIKTKKSSFIPLHNDYSFLDIELKTNIDSVLFTKYTRLRILMEVEDLQSDLTEFIDKISSKTKILSTKTIFKEKTLQAKSIDDEEKDIDILDNREESIIKSFVKEEELKDILNIHQKLQKLIEISDMNWKNTLLWSIKKIEFMNIFCYGNDHLNIVDFNEGVTGILASNASGKTNILNTMLYGLFGNIYTRNQNQNNRNIISRHAKKKDLYVKLTIILGENEIYYIERKAKSRKRSKTSGEEQILLTETVEFYTDDKILNLATKVETERLIRETLSFSTKEDFVLTNMISNISYGNGISIVSMNGSQLDEIFNNMFNLNKYKLLQVEAKNICKDLSQKIKTLTGKIEVLSEQTHIDINDIKQYLSRLEKELTQHENDKKSRIVQLENIYDKFSIMNKKSIEESKESLEEKLKENDEDLNGHDILKLIEKEDFYNMEISRIEDIFRDEEVKKYLKQQKIQNLQERDIVEIEKDISFYEGQKQKISFENDITDEYIKAKKMIQIYKKEDKLDLEEIKKSIINMSFDEVKQCYFVSIKERESLLVNLNKTYINNEDFLRYKKIIEDKEERDMILNKNIEIQQKINSLKTELKNNKINNAHNLRNIYNKYTDYLELIDIYYESQEIKKKIEMLNENKEYSELLQQKSKIDLEIQEISNKIVSKTSRYSILQEKIKTYEDNMKLKIEIQNELRESEQQYKYHKIYLDVINSKNLPKHLISNVVKNICNEANELIYNSCGLLCEIQENEKWEIIIKKDNIIVGPEHCSGYERFVINIALKIAFDKFKQLPTIKLFLIDEVIDCVSEDNLEEIDNILFYLKRQYSNVFLISHNEELKKKVENRIMITVKGGCSYLG